MARRRTPPGRGPWDRPVSKLQAARFEIRRTRQEIADAVRAQCPGHRGRAECLLDADKLGEYERGTRHPGRTHMAALCRIYKKSPEDLGLVEWRDAAERQESGDAGGAVTPSAEPVAGDSGDRAVPSANVTSQTNIRYPVRDIESRLLALSGDALAVPGLFAHEGRGSGDEAMHRDAFLKGAGAAVGAALIDPVITVARRVQEELAFTKVRWSEIERLAEAALWHARNFARLTDPPEEEALLVDWATSGWLLKQSQTPSQRMRLSEVHARLCGVLGDLCALRRDHTRAGALFQTGQAAAHEAGAGSLLAWLLERECSVIEDSQGDPHRVVKLGQRALSSVGAAAGLIEARIHARVSRTHALLGDARAALASLDSADASLAKASSGCWPTSKDMPLSSFAFSPELLAVTRGEVCLRVQSPAAAKSACEETSLLLKETRGSDKSVSLPQNEINLATSISRMGDLEHACHIAVAALREYEGAGIAFVEHRAWKFLRGLGPGGDTPYAQPISELITDRRDASRSLPT